MQVFNLGFVTGQLLGTGPWDSLHILSAPSGGRGFVRPSAPSGGRAGCARGENRTSLWSLRRFSLDLASPALPPDGATLPLLRGGVCARATISRTVQDPSNHRPRSSARALGGQCTSRNFVHPCMKIKVSCTDIALMSSSANGFISARVAGACFRAEGKGNSQTQRS